MRRGVLLWDATVAGWGGSTVVGGKAAACCGELGAAAWGRGPTSPSTEQEAHLFLPGAQEARLGAGVEDSSLQCQEVSLGTRGSPSSQWGLQGSCEGPQCYSLLCICSKSPPHPQVVPTYWAGGGRFSFFTSQQLCVCWGAGGAAELRLDCWLLPSSPPHFFSIVFQSLCGSHGMGWAGFLLKGVRPQ